MSATTDSGGIDLRAELARIDRDRAESQKLQAETTKFVAEQLKLAAEAAKLDRDRIIAPWVPIAALMGGTLGLATFIAHLLGR